MLNIYLLGFPGGSEDKESACNTGDLGSKGSIPGLGGFHGGGARQPTLVFLLGESPWTEVPGATVHGVTRSQTRLSD